MLPVHPVTEPCNIWPAASVGVSRGWKPVTEGHSLCARGLTMRRNLQTLLGKDDTSWTGEEKYNSVTRRNIERLTVKKNRFENTYNHVYKLKTNSIKIPTTENGGNDEVGCSTSQQFSPLARYCKRIGKSQESSITGPCCAPVLDSTAPAEFQGVAR